MVLRPEKEQAIVDSYQDGTNMRQCALLHGVGEHTVKRVLVRRGVYDAERARTPSGTTERERDEIIKRYERGDAVKFIVEDLGLPSQNKVYAALAARGKPTRPRGSTGRAVPVGSTNTDVRGYVTEKVGPEWPYLGSMRGGGGTGFWIAQHRKVMAEHLGRALLTTEQVHHIDNDPSNNDIRNLQLTVSGHGNGSALRCRACGSCDVETVSLR